ncbi:MAG: radical SAM protein [Deltaproteobacteria bacterium]|nr:MAG: radical SAM protein [Deltaproteobacteria bacterium]
MTSFQDESYSLAPHKVLKRLEKPCLYDIENDELYELSEDAFRFLLQCSLGKKPSVRQEDEEFIQYCLSEKLISVSGTPIARGVISVPSPVPSLRYLELQITDRCNLRCRHCYLGDGRHRDLPLNTIEKVFVEFEEIQGLRLLLSGGEPLLHPHFWRINEVLENYAFRSVLLSNGTLIDRESARRLRVHEVQISLDGMKEGHEAIRGQDTYDRAIRAIDRLQEVGIRVSIATMIHHKNLQEFERLASLIRSKNIEEWNVDLPCIEGRLKDNRDSWVSPAEAGRFLQYGYGGGLHSSGENSTCGVHLCAIMPPGMVAKCGLFRAEPVGSVEEGLRVCWERIPRISLQDLACHCGEMEACRGGCRYRAKGYGGLYHPDPLQCYARGVLRGGEDHDDSESL